MPVPQAPTPTTFAPPAPPPAPAAQRPVGQKGEKRSAEDDADDMRHPEGGDIAMVKAYPAPKTSNVGGTNTSVLKTKIPTNENTAAAL